QPGRALERLQERGFDYAPVLDGKSLRGVLTQGAALRALEAGARDIAGYLDDVASVPASTGLDEVLGQLLREPQPLAVTGDDGEFVGWLSRKKVVQLVTPALDSAA
ncbi:MAG: CBS domain-containing protein, partial [Pseudomonas sp.]